MLARVIRTITLSVTALGLAVPSAVCTAQAGTSATDIPYSRVDVYAGYGYFHPLNNAGIGGHLYPDISNLNATASISYFFNRYVGVQVEGSYFSGDGVFLLPPCPPQSCYTHDQKLYTAEAGPILRWPLGRFVPFIHALGGGVKINGPVYQPLTWGWGVTGGGGLDYILPFFHDRFAIRPIQADYQYSQVVYGPLVLPAATSGGFGEINALKLSGGIVARFGGWSATQSIMLGCTTQPATVFAGEPVTVTASTMYTNPKHKQMYAWSSNGGRVTPSGNSATIDTTGLTPGDYTVSGHVQETSRAKDQANCTAPFTVRSYEPPTISCAANPASVPSGTPVDISTVGVSPQNRPLTYSYLTSAGQITSSGPTARLSTAGLGASTITVTCNLVDDLGKTATATTQVSVQVPTVPTVLQTKDLCSLSFTRDSKRPVRVDNEAKGCLDDIGLTMNQQTDGKLIIIGNASPDEAAEAAAERTLNVRQYLTQEKGIDPSRIDLRVGDTSGRTVRNVLVPAGAIFSDAGTQTFDEKAITRHGQAYGTGIGGAPMATSPRTRHRAKRRKRIAAPAATDASNATVPPQ